ncbi:uncharacterized protein DS421_15g512500 [Arachis hypogaea]|nr:uncharacterized protein DS421_15g512500 [Arachis hypogaea]
MAFILVFFLKDRISFHENQDLGPRWTTYKTKREISQQNLSKSGNNIEREGKSKVKTSSSDISNLLRIPQSSKHAWNSDSLLLARSRTQASSNSSPSNMNLLRAFHISHIRDSNFGSEPSGP